MKNIFLTFAQKQMGTGHLEADSTKRLFWSFFQKILQTISNTRFPIGSKARCFIERLRGAKLGQNIFLGGGCVLDRVRPDLVVIEDYVSLAGGVIILTHSNPTEPLREILGPKANIQKEVIIKRGAWIAVNCVILPGVTIGECAIIASGSVVNKDVPPYTLYGGVPAKFIKNLSKGD